MERDRSACKCKWLLPNLQISHKKGTKGDKSGLYSRNKMRFVHLPLRCKMMPIYIANTKICLFVFEENRLSHAKPIPNTNFEIQRKNLWDTKKKHMRYKEKMYEIQKKDLRYKKQTYKKQKKHMRYKKNELQKNMWGKKKRCDTKKNMRYKENNIWDTKKYEIQRKKDMRYKKIVRRPRKSLQGPGHFPLPTKIPSEKTTFLRFEYFIHYEWSNFI